LGEARRDGRELPAYRRLSAALRAAVEEGQFEEGECLPTEAELSLEHGVSRHTVRQAFQDLVADGLVYRVPGRGTFVTGLSSRRGRYLRSVGTLEEMMTWAGTEMEVLAHSGDVRGTGGGLAPRAALRRGGEAHGAKVVRRGPPSPSPTSTSIPRSGDA
jgi:DNA-binding GntR family transcriptional regulator